MGDIVQEVIYDLLQFRRAAAESTRVFTRLMHDSDLCPKFQSKLELILGAFRKYQQITYDLQGFRDRGTDVVVRQPSDDETRFICVQIKSEDDLKKPDYMTKLKAQSFETQATYKILLDYYLVLCCSVMESDFDKKTKLSPISRKKKLQIRAISAEFATVGNIHVIEPEFAVAFLQLSSVQIDAAVKSKLGAQDVVFREALNLVNRLTPTEKALLLYLLWLRIYREKNEISPDDVLGSSQLHYLYQSVPVSYRDEDSEEAYRHAEGNLGSTSRIQFDLEYLEDNFVERNSVGNYILDLKEVQSLAVLMMDGNLRYKYEEDELLTYMMNLFGPMDRDETQADLL